MLTGRGIMNSREQRDGNQSEERSLFYLLSLGNAVGLREIVLLVHSFNFRRINNFLKAWIVTDRIPDWVKAQQRRRNFSG
jgi:hypothetical protein